MLLLRSYSAPPPNHSTRPSPFRGSPPHASRLCLHAGHESESSGSGGGGRWPTATTAGCPPLANQPARKRGAARPFRRVDPSQGFRARNPAIAVSSADSAVCCPDWVSRYRQTGPDRGQPSSAPGPGTGRLGSFQTVSLHELDQHACQLPRITGKNFWKQPQAGSQAQIINFRAHARRHHMPTHLPFACAAINGPYLARYIHQGRADNKNRVASIQDYLHPAI